MNLDERLGLLTYKNDHESHVLIKDPAVCLDKCKDKACIFLCPAEVYLWISNEGEQIPAMTDGKPAEQWPAGKIKVQFENCIECGGCRMICPYLNIDCHWPRGGLGVSYKYG